MLVVDDRRRELDDAREPFDVLRPNDIGLDVDEFHRLAAIYDVMELATAVKPWLLATLVERSHDVVLYFDPDIYVYRSLNAALGDVEGVELTLTPHVTHPMIRDDRIINETHILASGIFNLGFIGVGPRSGPFLGFWKERLARECIVDARNMRFVDQRWVDFAPGIFDVRILRDTALNVAYWNLDQRELKWQVEEYFVDGEPLLFFHFSGYDPNMPELVSKHEAILCRHYGRMPRVLLSDRPVLAQLYEDYRHKLESAGHSELSCVGYGFSRSDNGLVLNQAMRTVYREALIEAEKRGHQRPPNPFEDADGFIAWLNEPVAGTRMTRYENAVWLSDQDLRERFIDAPRRDYRSFAQWFHTEANAGRYDYRLARGQAQALGFGSRGSTHDSVCRDRSDD